MGKKSFRLILLGLLAITSLMISACSTGSGDDSPATSYTVTFYSSTAADADTTGVNVPAGGQIDIDDFPVGFADDPADGRVFLEWSIYPTGKGAIVDEDSIITSSMALYPIWGHEISDLAGITDPNGAYKLVADIEIPGVTAWTPIGIGSTNTFSGVLYGDGHIVTNLKLPATPNPGLFGILNNAYIRDLHIGLNNEAITNASTTATMGGLAAQAINGTVINNVSVSGDMNITLTGYGYVGLIVGRLEDSTINNSFTTGNLTVTTQYFIYAGGIAGYMHGGTVDSSYVLGAIVANTSSITPENSAYAGGIAGYAYSGSALSKNVVVSSNISSANSGWIAGDSSGTQFSNNYFQSANAQTSAINDKDGASVVLVDLAFFRTIGWDFSNAWADPNPDRLYSYPVAKRENGAAWVDLDFDTAADVKTRQVIYYLLTDISSVPSTSNDFLLWDSLPSGRGELVNNVKTTVPLDIYAIEGRKIATAEDLADMTQQLGDSFTYNYMLIADIDLTTHGAWQPVGNATTPFISTFYGNGYVIRGINLANVVNTGLFGYLQNAYIRDLTLEADTFYSTPANQIRSAGVLAGVISTGTYINNITIAGSINVATSAGELHLGGIAGEISSNINNSIVTAEVSGTSSTSYSRVGGIAGVNNGVTIARSVTTGPVYALSSTSSPQAYAGGIVGLNQANSLVTTSYSTGTVKAENATNTVTSAASAGGIVGYNYGNVFATYSTGDIDAINSGNSGGNEHRANAGGIAGQNQGIVSVSYASGDIDSYTDDYSHSAGVVADLRTANGRVLRTVAANSTLTVSPNTNWSGRVVGYNNDWATLPNVAQNYANSNMTINGSYRNDTNRDGTGKTLRDLGLQQTYEALNSLTIAGSENLKWDFVNTWKTDGQSLPIFIWQN